jgi:hypothetical protein
MSMRKMLQNRFAKGRFSSSSCKSYHITLFLLMSLLKINELQLAENVNEIDQS